MDHAEAREALELAAVEPGGLDRLVAGDTPAAAALAGHLAGCDACAATLIRLRRDAGVIRDLVLTTPPPDLRDRTLAFVAELGRPRPSALQPASGAESVPAGVLKPVPADPTVAARRSDRAPLRWIAALAAVLVLAVAATGLLVSAQRDATIARLDAELQRQAAAIGALNRITTRSLQVAAQPDARSVALEGATDLAGSIVFSPGSGDLVIVAEGLTPPPAGREFRCWMEIDGERVPIGRMFFGGALAFWAGPVSDRAALAKAERFGVTLVDAAGTSVDGEPILSGED
jgi:hypothetical protein